MKPFVYRLLSKPKHLLRSALGVSESRKPSFGGDLNAALRHLRQWQAGDLVFDVGANTGQTVHALRKILPDPRIFAFEPVKPAFELLRERTAQWPNVRCFQYALGAEPCRRRIYYHKDRLSMNSFQPWWEPTDSEEVVVTTLDDVMEKEKIEFIHFLKVDTEGFELQVLQGAKKSLDTSRIGLIQVEVGFDPEVWAWTGFEAVRQYLAPKGYLFHGFYEQNFVKASVPSSWDEEARRGYEPWVVNRCNALFVCASPAGLSANRRDADDQKTRNGEQAAAFANR